MKPRLSSESTDLMLHVIEATREDDAFLVRKLVESAFGDGAGWALASLKLDPKTRDGLSCSPGDVRGASYLIPITMELGPARCSTRVCEKPTSCIQPWQSAPV